LDRKNIYQNTGVIYSSFKRANKVKYKIWQKDPLMNQIYLNFENLQNV